MADLRSEEIGKIVRAERQERDGHSFVVIEAKMIGAGAAMLLKELEEHGLTLFFEFDPLPPTEERPAGWHHASDAKVLPSYPELALHWFHDNGSQIFQGPVNGRFLYVLSRPNGETIECDMLKDAKAAATASEVQDCAACGTKSYILIRSIEDTFWCKGCGKWQPCVPPRQATGETP